MGTTMNNKNRKSHYNISLYIARVATHEWLIPRVSHHPTI